MRGTVLGLPEFARKAFRPPIGREFAVRFAEGWPSWGNRSAGGSGLLSDLQAWTSVSEVRPLAAVQGPCDPSGWLVRVSCFSILNTWNRGAQTVKVIGYNLFLGKSAW